MESLDKAPVFEWIFEYHYSVARRQTADTYIASSSHFRIHLSFSGKQESRFLIASPKTLEFPSNIIKYFDIRPNCLGIGKHTGRIDSKSGTNDGSRLKWFMEGKSVMFIDTYNQICSLLRYQSHPISFQSLVGSALDRAMFDAFMIKDNNFDRMIAFGGDYVAVIDVGPSNYTHWILLHPKELIRTHPIWSGAPVYVKATAWISRDDWKAVDQ